MGFIRVVLVSPCFAGNVGAIARLAANFDVSDIVVVMPRCELSSVDARMMATGVSIEELRCIRVVSTLHEALDGCSYRIGFTCRDTKLDTSNVFLSNCEEWLDSLTSTALVFGPEDRGLERADLALCSHICEIPTSQRKQSMNLSHAVAVALARLFEVREQKEMPHDSVVNMRSCASAVEIDSLMARWRVVLNKFHFGKRAGGIDAMEAKIRNLLVRAKPSFHEIKILHSFLARVDNAGCAEKVETGE